MSECGYEQMGEKTTRITGARFVPAPEFRVKLEGAGKIGERYVGLVGIRDPYTIAHVDDVIGWARTQGRARFRDTRYELHYIVYGREGGLGALGPMEERAGREACIFGQGVAPA